MAKVSVIVPIYNVEKYIGTLIESIQSQTLKDIQIILVDDGTPDSSGSICDDYASKDSRIVVIHKANGGVSAARNDGFNVAEGEYVIFCDSDDWLPENALESLYNEAIIKDADIVIGDVYQSQDGIDRRVRFYDHPFTTTDPHFINLMIQADMYKMYCPMPSTTGPAFGYGGPWNKLVRRQMLIDNGIKFDMRVKGIFDDILFTAHILANAKTISYIDVPVYYYRIIPVSITRTFKANALEINDAIFNSWKEFISKYDKENIFMESFSACVVRRLVEILPIYFFSEKNKKSIFEKAKELKEVISQETYVNAAKLANPSKLSPKIHGIVRDAIIQQSPWKIIFAYYLSKLRNSIKNKR